MAELIEQTYAQALFEVAIENKKLNEIQSELDFVLEVFEKHPTFYEIYNTPRISKEEKKQIVSEVFEKKISPEVTNFLKILLDKSRTTHLKEIVKVYQRLANHHNGIVEGIALTAIPLKDKDKVAIEEKLSQIMGKKIKIKNEVDPSIIGGMRIRIGDKVIDGTVQSRLNELKERFAQIIV